VRVGGDASKGGAGLGRLSGLAGNLVSRAGWGPAMAQRAPYRGAATTAPLCSRKHVLRLRGSGSWSSWCKGLLSKLVSKPATGRVHASSEEVLASGELPHGRVLEHGSVLELHGGSTHNSTGRYTQMDITDRLVDLLRRVPAHPQGSAQTGDEYDELLATYSYDELLAEGVLYASEDWLCGSRGAANAYRKAIALRPDEPTAYYNLGAALQHRWGHEAEAAQRFLEAKERYPVGSEQWVQATGKAIDMLRQDALQTKCKMASWAIEHGEYDSAEAMSNP